MQKLEATVERKMGLIVSIIGLSYLEEKIIQVPDKNTLEAFSWLLIWGRKYQAQISDTNFSIKIKSLVANILNVVIIVIGTS